MEYLQLKWKLWFNALDVNHDGKIDMEDLKDMRASFAKMHSELEASQREDAQKNLDSWWNKYIFRGRTGGISVEEFVAGMTKEYQTDKAKFIQEYTDCEKEIFNIIDTNHDRSISEDEYLMALRAFGHENIGLDTKFFNSYGPENGVVPIKKCADSWAQFLTCEDTSKPDLVKTALESGL